MYKLYKAFSLVCLVISSFFLLSACGVGNEQGFTEAVEVNTKNLTAITVTSSNSRVRVGESESYTAIGVVGDGSEQIDISSSVSWSSSDPTIVSIDSNGIASGLANGTVDISASLSDLSGSKSLVSSDSPLSTITISNQPGSISLCQTSDSQLVATGTYADGGQAIISDKVTWSSSAPAIIFIGNEALGNGSRLDKGVLSSLSAGNATIVASHESIDSDDLLLTSVADLNAITVSSADSALYANETSQFIAMGDYGSDPVEITNNVSWTSSDTSVLSFSDTQPGLSSLLLPGSVSVSAVCDQGGGSELTSTVLAVDIQDAVTVSSLRIKHGNRSYDDGATITFDLNDGDEQLELVFVYSNNNEGSTDLSSEEEVTWSVIGQPLSGEAPDISGTGVVSFDTEGESEYKVRYKNDDLNINVDIDFFIKVE